jgi:hypothetical protein
MLPTLAAAGCRRGTARLAARPPPCRHRALSAAAAAAAASPTVDVAPRTLQPGDIMMGVPWLSPVPGLPDSLNNRPGQEHANAVIAAALEAGIVDYDTAPLYGMGCSEEVFGTALAAAKAAGVAGAEEALIYTKMGRLIRNADGTAPCAVGFEAAGAVPLEERTITNDYSAAGVDTSLAESLERMTADGVVSHTIRVRGCPQ